MTNIKCNEIDIIHQFEDRNHIYHLVFSVQNITGIDHPLTCVKINSYFVELHYESKVSLILDFSDYIIRRGY